MQMRPECWRAQQHRLCHCLFKGAGDAAVDDLRLAMFAVRAVHAAFLNMWWVARPLHPQIWGVGRIGGMEVLLSGRTDNASAALGSART